MAKKIQHKRGSKKNLPSLSEGEIAFTLDTKEVFIGTTSGENEEIITKSSKTITDMSTLLEDTTNRLLEVRVSDPVNAPVGKMWVREDLMNSTESESIRIMTHQGIMGISGLTFNLISNKPKLATFIYTRDRIIIAYSSNKLYYSDDLGVTFSKELDIPGIPLIKYIHVFSNGTLMFCDQTKAYYSTDFKTYYESTLLDEKGNRLTLTGYENLSNYNHNHGTMIVDGLEMLVWGNYSTVYETTFKNVRVWYTIDNGKTIKVAYKFKSAGDTGNNEVARHVHCVAFNKADSSFWLAAGDHLDGGIDERNLIKGMYNKATDKWTWNTIGTGDHFKITNMVFLDGYIYYSWDMPRGGVIRAPYNEISNVSKHVQLFQTENDTNDLIMSERGEFIVTQTIYGGTDPAKNFYYSPDRINFHKIVGTMPLTHDFDGESIYYSVRPPNANGNVLAGVVSTRVSTLEDWGLTPSVFLDEMVRAAGFPNAFKPLSFGDVDIIPPVVTLSPIKDSYLVGESLSLSTNKEATIYYTIDGTTPTEKSTIYTKPIVFEFSASGYIKYFAKDKAGNKSIVKQKAITVIEGNPTSIVTRGMTGYWNSKKGATTTLWENLAPETKGKYNGTVSGAVVKPDGMTFSGTDSYVSIPVPTEMTNTTDVTFEFRTKLSNYSPSVEILSYTSSYSIYLSNGSLYVEFVKDVAGVYVKFPVAANEEFTLTILRRQSDGYMDIYKNGVLLTEGKTMYGTRPNTSFFIEGNMIFGRGFTGNQGNAIGIIDNIKIYNRLLTKSEIDTNRSYGNEIGLSLSK